MSKSQQRKKRWYMIVIYIFMLLILLSLLTVASYTWFSLSRTPRVSDMNMYISSKTGLEISTDPKAEEWQLQLDFRDIVDETAPLRPVTWSNYQQKFIAATYGLDGRLTGYETWQPLTDSRNANKDNADGYYIKTTIYARSGETVDVTLSPAVEVDEGINGAGTYVIGTPLWDSEQIRHDNGGQGAETAIRIGIRITYVNEDGEDITEEIEKEPQFFIYEPNCDTHIDGTGGYIETPSIDGTASLINADNIIRQTTSSWREADPVERSVVIKDLGKFEESPILFNLTDQQIAKIDLYIWLEGQDVDCTNQIQAAQIFANIQFAGDPEIQSGLVPIE